MKNYLIRIESGDVAQFTTVYGDTPSRPFMIAHNLWNYKTPGHAARRLEKLAQAWEKRGHVVTRVYGTVFEMPTAGDTFNVWTTLDGYNK